MFGEPRAERFLRKTQTEVGLMTKEEEEDALELLMFDGFEYDYLGSPNEENDFDDDLDEHIDYFEYEMSHRVDPYWDDFDDD